MSTKIEIYNPEKLGRPLGLYKHITRVKASEFLFLAGQLSVDNSGNIIGKNDFEEQMKQVFSNIREALRSAGTDFKNVVKFTTFLKRDSDIGDFMRVRKILFSEFFKTGDFPPNTLLVVSRLVHESFLIEVETIAAL